MVAKTSAATERALARVAQGESAYAAAKAEGIALSTIYRAMRRLKRVSGLITVDPKDAREIDAG